MYEADAMDCPTAPLFHYTSWEGFEGIMRSRSFWFTSIYQMNDATELTYGFGITRRLFKAANIRAAMNNTPADWLVQKFCEPLIEDGNVSGITGRFDFYSASFGQRDEPHQWKEYGDDGRGIAIGLAEKFFKPEYKSQAESHEHNYLGKVIYDPAECEARHLKPIQEALDIIIREAHLESFKNGKEAAGFCRRLASELHVPLIWNSITTKERKWEPENETRLLVVIDLLKPQLAVQTRPRDSRRYVEIPLALFEPGTITEIMVGPSASSGVEERISDLLDQLGFPGTPKITHAKAVM